MWQNEVIDVHMDAWSKPIVWETEDENGEKKWNNNNQSLQKVQLVFTEVDGKLLTKICKCSEMSYRNF